ncbi:MAG TPA: DUF4331 domain-containing protein [Thermoanaerobaculia bacterium]|nr:DUF4331 domain-containing protein [Thermoanaerobaculia bacterium]
MSRTGELRLRGLVTAGILAAAALFAPAGALASSHNEAPFTSRNPSLDDTDFYMFRDPNDPSMVNLIACRYGLIEPQGGPNYAGFQDGAWYDIKIDNNGDGIEDVTFRFTFKTQYKQPSTFLYALPGLTSITDPNLLVTQTYSLDRITGFSANPSPGQITRILTDQPVFPPNIGPKTFPNYVSLPNGIQKSADGKISVFVGPRQDPFFVDLGMVFDAVNLEVGAGNGRPGVGVGATGSGRDTLFGYTVLATALQVPIANLTSVGFQVGDPANSAAVIGGWASISIPASRTINANGSVTTSGNYVQVSRLGNPLVNELLVGVGRKDYWNSQGPGSEAQFKGDASNPGELFPILATYMNVLFGINVPPAPRGDIELALFRGLGPAAASQFGVQINSHPGEVYADELRLNTAVQPTPFSSANRLGYLGGDQAGFPNGRRPCDDVVDIELRVVAGVLQGGAFAGSPNSLLGDGVDFPERGCRYYFPFMWSPTSGFAAFHAGPPQPAHNAQVKAIRDSNAKGFPEGISDEEFAERVRIARDRDDLAKIQPANVK